MRYRSTIALFILFIAGLGVLWWADQAKVPTRSQRAVLLNRILPELIDTPLHEISRIEVDRGGGKDRIVVVRREASRWQLIEPIDVAADANVIETLIRNLKDLSKSPDAGAITDDPAPYGLDQTAGTLKIFSSSLKPLAYLKLGKTVADRLYIRAGEESSIEVVDARLLTALTAPLIKWRDPALFHLPSFRVLGVSIDAKTPNSSIKLQRDERRWRILSPIKVPADDDKVEGLVAELTALRVAEGSEGYVEDNAEDREKYGLLNPSMTLSMSPFGGGKANVVSFGNPVPGHPSQVYAMNADQNDVVKVDLKLLRQAGLNTTSLRSQKVLDFLPARVNRLRIEALGKLFDLSRTNDGWLINSPAKEKADNASVQSLLLHLADLKASEFLESSRVAEPRFDKPSYKIKAWQAGLEKKKSAAVLAEEPSTEPLFELTLGRRDLLKKTIYGKIPGDDAILALPTSGLDDLPKNAFAFRNRAILDLKPQQFTRISIERNESTVTVEAPGATGSAVHWRMVEPVKAPVDDAAVTTMILFLANLRAETWESETVSPNQGSAYGFDRPRIRLTFTLQAGADSSASKAIPKTLRVGKQKPGTLTVYANIEGEPSVFALNPALILAFEAELHDPSVMAFNLEQARRVDLLWPTRSLSLIKTPSPSGLGSSWQIAPGYDPFGFDLARIDSLIKSLAELKTPRFLQYDGPLPASSGLDHPRLTIRVDIETPAKMIRQTLRIGNNLSEDVSKATNSSRGEGPVFILPLSAVAKELLKTPPRRDDLPDPIFTPDPPSTKPSG